MQSPSKSLTVSTSMNGLPGQASLEWVHKDIRQFDGVVEINPVNWNRITQNDGLSPGRQDCVPTRAELNHFPSEFREREGLKQGGGGANTKKRLPPVLVVSDRMPIDDGWRLNDSSWQLSDGRQWLKGPQSGQPSAQGKTEIRDPPGLRGGARVEYPPLLLLPAIPDAVGPMADPLDPGACMGKTFAGTMTGCTQANPRNAAEQKHATSQCPNNNLYRKGGRWHACKINNITWHWFACNLP